MAYERVRPSPDKLMILLECCHGARPIAAEGNARPDGKENADYAKHIAQNAQHRRLRREWQAKPTWVPAPEQKGVAHDKKRRCAQIPARVRAAKRAFVSEMTDKPNNKE